MPTSVYPLSKEETSEGLCERTEHGIACCVLYPHYPVLSLDHRKTLTRTLLSSAVGSSAHTVPALFLSVIDRRRRVTEGSTPGKSTRVLLPFKALSPSLTSHEADGSSLLRRSEKAHSKVFSMGTSTYLSKRCGTPQEESGDG